tara:strand:+ start:550 stop:915 length:366 start_codon:yes stop_codon:yes gene_type:complete
MKENNFLKRSKIIEKNQVYLTEAVQTLTHLSMKAIYQEGKLIFADIGGSAAEVEDMSADYLGTLVISNKRNPFPSSEKKESRVYEKSFFAFKAISSMKAIIQELQTIVGHKICSIVLKEFS